jgi:hypothetical protein
MGSGGKGFMTIKIGDQWQSGIGVKPGGKK